MLETPAQLRREAIRTTLTQRVGSATDAIAIAYCAAEVWAQITTRLQPVIGMRGVDALFRRALHQTSMVFPWLAIVEAAEKNGVVSLEGLKTCLAGQEITSAAEASYALLVRFVELLAGLIGDSLMERLLGPVWAPSLPARNKESGS